MDGGLTYTSLLSLFIAMVILAAIPGISVTVVVSRTVCCGFSHGIMVILGIISGDIVYILVAIFGLLLLVESLGQLAYLISYLAGGYLIWMSVNLWRHQSHASSETRRPDQSLWSGYVTGLLVTMADQKAVVFYLAFFPAFVELAVLSWLDSVLIVIVTIIAVGGVKMFYAWLAIRTGRLLGHGLQDKLNKLAAALLGLTGLVLIMRA